MNRYNSLLAFCCILLTTTAFAQLKFNIRAMPVAGTYGVYVKPCDGIMPTETTITGTGQATIVLPAANQAKNLKLYAGTWVEGGTVLSPPEATNKNYFSYGFLADSPKIMLEPDKETLLFTVEITGPAGAVPTVFNNQTDPFAVIPNSQNTNPGNELSILDFGIFPVGYYFYSGNYSDDNPESCVNVIDTTQTEPTDTTGNGGNTTPTLEEMTGDHFFSLSPNPASTFVNLDFSGLANHPKANLRLLTAQGFTVMEQTLAHAKGTLSLSIQSLTTGIYFMSYEVEGRVLQRERFIKH